MISFYQDELKLKDLEDEVKTGTEARQQLQTKFDMEVRSKEELISLLGFYRNTSLILHYDNYSSGFLEKYKDTLQKNINDWSVASFLCPKRLFMLTTRSTTFKEKGILDLSGNYSCSLVLDIAKREQEKESKSDFPFFIKLSENNKKAFANKGNAL